MSHVVHNCMAYFKQILVIRTDLKMRRGKEIAQGAHASMKATLENLDHPAVKEWLSGPFTKVAVAVSSEDELNEIVENANTAGIITAKIIDAGKTEFNNVPTFTCAAIGPADSDDLDKITGHLKLR